MADVFNAGIGCSILCCGFCGGLTKCCGRSDETSAHICGNAADEAIEAHKCESGVHKVLFCVCYCVYNIFDEFG